MDIDVNQYLSIFVEESKEHLQSMNDVLLSLERNPSDLGHINEIFRVAHTIKGMSGTMGFHSMADLTHEMENLLQAARSEEIPITEEVIDVLFECFDALDASVENIITNGEEIKNNEELVNEVLSLLEKEENAVKNKENSEVILDEYVLDAIKEAEDEKLNAYEITVSLEDDIMLKSARSFMVFNTLSDYGDVIYSNPSAEDIEDEKFDKSFYLIFITKDDKEVIKGSLERISEIEKVEISEFSIDDYMEELVEIDKEKSKTRSSEDPDTSSTKAIGRIRKTVRVDIDRLDNLMNLVSELIIVKTRIEGLEDSQNISASDMTETTEYLDRITTNLHDAVMKVRMVPIERVFNRFPRLVRDLSRELDKEIDLEMSGEETEVDRTIIDEIGDPLIHIIRNSLDHGIEHPDERVKAGKPEVGKIVLKAYPDGNNVVIEVEDDGAGIDPDKIREISIEKELITEEEARKISDDEAVRLLFEAGFSTSKEISDVSGRGVGLDVVRSKIESINGYVEVDTELGKGTKFIIRIPLTLAIIQALMVSLQDEIFAIPLSSVAEITTINHDIINNIQGQEVIVYRDHTIPIIKLHEILDIEPVEDDDKDECIVVIVNKGDRQAGLLIDDLIGQQEIVIKSLGRYLNDVRYLSGATILGDGSISLIIDINSLI